MTQSEPIVCKPTPWFLLRAVAMFLMFAVFAFMFYRDGSVGYRQENEVFYLNQAFQKANKDFSRMNSSGTLTADEWKQYAAAQTVIFPENPAELPSGMKLPMPWPEILQNYEKVKPLQWNSLWIEYTGKRGWDSTVAEEPHTLQKINEQWTVFWICLALALVALFFLIRTLGRSISVDDSGVSPASGRKVAFADLKVLDLRKWETKGLGFIDYDGASGKGRIRIDGLTYGGFKKEQGEPAEKLMQFIRSRFSGEIIEYTAVADEETADSEEKTA
ncbi:hypothetical protein JIN85_15985 [Luteolibacter pohnpeiensis]|uniref:Uncharacterized protein n=1 Tax=Luteolibacter pohnpeiensis TaxID=454153 RepID=A0A934S9V3_9BACT|nr:hypothetical protein [Luteolibacter pohnpeiensis]MBK1883919.1 hypothetical protein [Luteolibacter pohnpeiensis]